MPTSNEKPAVKLPSAPKADDLDYNSYLKVPELLELQQPLSTPAHHDEMLFIVIHQAYELWFKLLLHELDKVRDYLNSNEPLHAHHFMSRCVKVMEHLVKQIHLLETMAPAHFLKFRTKINPASGFQSLQYRDNQF